MAVLCEHAPFARPGFGFGGFFSLQRACARGLGHQGRGRKPLALRALVSCYQYRMAKRQVHLLQADFLFLGPC